MYEVCDGKNSNLSVENKIEAIYIEQGMLLSATSALSKFCAWFSNVAPSRRDAMHTVVSMIGSGCRKATPLYDSQLLADVAADQHS